ncbi:TonB-dependent receptor [Chitinophaga sp. YIM B06452]|uniref:SusC/RagA family TonB-linked outer membrane protein n=1 Tax=Chitinophaga sp. YIM B06452 TaxID=3082158 RepID=UPI0031FF2F06
MRKILCLFTCLFLIAVGANAQVKVISGKITDATGAQLPFVTVSIKGTSSGTISKQDGTYSLQVPPQGKVLVFSTIGMKVKEVEIGDKTEINVTLETGVNELEEFVAVAYGSQRKTAFTGSASTITAEPLQARPVASFDKALQGLATGITVQSASGQPGGSSTIRIRGASNFASSQPLFVLDGVAIAEGDYTQASTTANILSTLDPKDIETITVLKDATAAGLYGSRAANGVVVITTKKGRAGRSNINFSANNGWSSIAVDRHAMMGGAEFYKYYWDYYNTQNLAAGQNAATAATNANNSTINILKINPYNTAQPLGAGGALNNGAKLLYDTDWRDAVMNQGRTEDYAMNVSGGNEKTKFYFGGSYFNQKGIILASNFKRYSARVNLEHAVNSFIKAGVNTTLSYTDQNTPAGAGGAANPIRFSEIVSNVYPLYQLDANGNPVPAVSGDGYEYYYRTPLVMDYNPVGLAKNNIYRAKTVRGIFSPWVEVSFLKNFKFKTLGAVDYFDINETRFYNPEHGDGASVKGRTSRYRPRNLDLTLTNMLSYDRQFGAHTVGVMVGQEALNFTYENSFMHGTTFPFGGIYELEAAATPVQVSTTTTQKRMLSWFSRLNYSYADKYYVTGGVRRDGSSVFGSDKRYGVFWNVGGGWRVGREDFLAAQTWIDELKLKASYGTSGNDNSLGRYARLGLYKTGNNYNGLPGITYNQLENTELQWESNKVLDIGLEFAFLRRFRGEIGYFNRKSEDLLFDKPISYLTGFESISSNLASIRNTGFEAMVEATIFNTKDFNWTASVNYTKVNNKILSMNVDSLVDPNASSKRLKIGKDRYQFYLREWAGVDPADGRPQWYQNEMVNGQLTGKKVITKDYNAATRYEMGSSLPKFFGGFNNTFRYKDFDLSIYTFFSVGGKIYDNSYSQLMVAGNTPGQQMSPDMHKAWKKAGDVTDIPRFSPSNTDLGNSVSSRFLYDGTYARVKNINLGYQVPKSLLGRVGVANLRAYVSAENLFTWAKHKGVDPEMAIGGSADNDVPNVKTFTVGLNLGF